ncbi:hypothetical protein ACFX2B_006356 [Malus domestica]
MLSVRRYCFRKDVLSYSLNSITSTLRPIHYLIQTQINPVPKIASNGYFGIYERFLLYNFYSTKPPSRSFRRRERKRSESNRSTLDEVQFQRALSQLLPRFTPEELCNVITQQDNPFVCLELFNWASQQLRFRHDVSTYHITIKKLGIAKMYQEMDDVVNQVLAISYIGSEALYNSIIYFFTEARKLTRAVNIFKHMRNSRNMECRPSIRTYNILFTAFLSRGSNSYINHMYMETSRCLFRQMVDDGIEPDIYSLNSMIKGYVLSLHLNDALRIFHQMGVVYKCTPNSFSYDYLIHGLCCQGRTNNAKQLCNEMKSKGFMLSSKSYNSLVNALALHGEVEEALKYLWEMIENRRSAEFITYKTILDEICRQGRVGKAMKLLKEFEEKDVLSGHVYRKLLYVLEDDYGDPNAHAQFSAVKKSAQLTLRELSAKHVFTSISSLRTCSHGIVLVQDKARRTRRFFAQLVQEHHHPSLRIHKLTEKASGDATKKAALTAAISQFVKRTDQWLSVMHSINTAIKEIGDVENWMKIMEFDSQSINAAIHIDYFVGCRLVESHLFVIPLAVNQRPVQCTSTRQSKTDRLLCQRRSVVVTDVAHNGLYSMHLDEFLDHNDTDEQNLVSAIEHELYLADPSIKETKKLPEIPKEENYRNSVKVYGVGFDRSAYEHKVVTGIYNKHEHLTNPFIDDFDEGVVFSVCTLETDS